MVGNEFYHHWFLNKSNPRTLYVTTEGQFLPGPFIGIGNSERISWLEKKLSEHLPIYIEDVFYSLDIHKANGCFSSESVKEWLNAKIGLIGEDTECKIRELSFKKESLEFSKLLLFHPFLDQYESDELIRELIRNPDGSKNTAFQGSKCVGHMYAVSSRIQTLEYLPKSKTLNYTAQLQL
jgi:hypothetical protein